MPVAASRWRALPPVDDVAVLLSDSVTVFERSSAAGAVLVTGSHGGVSALAYAVVVALFFHLFVVLYEKPTLRATFGAEYVAYYREVPRWLPRLTPVIRGGAPPTAR